jgi:pimeloyl-ACP methyl ester carboxylesterase
MREITITSADGTKLAARCSGTGSRLVMVHGSMADLNAFALIENLLAERHTVWVYSRRGRGGSDLGPRYSLESEIEDVLAVLDAAGEDAHLFGHSAGGYYSLLAAPRARRLRSLIVYEPPSHADEIEPALFDRMAAALEAEDPARALEIFFPVAGIVDEEVKIIRAQQAIWEALCQGVRVFPREADALRAEGRMRLSAARLPDVPMLYLYGELTNAPSFPTLAEIATLLPKAEIQCLAGQRHMATIFDPERFANAVLAFTTAVDAQH